MHLTCHKYVQIVYQKSINTCQGSRSTGWCGSSHPVSGCDRGTRLPPWIAFLCESWCMDAFLAHQDRVISRCFEASTHGVRDIHHPSVVAIHGWSGKLHSLISPRGFPQPGSLRSRKLASRPGGWHVENTTGQEKRKHGPGSFDCFSSTKQWFSGSM